MKKKVKCSKCGFTRKLKRKTEYKIMKSWCCIICGKWNKK